MTLNEYNTLKQGCVFCNHTDLITGPTGGTFTNYYCGECGARYNVSTDPATGQIVGAPSDEAKAFVQTFA
jgi:transcription elongation factor Elf1